MFPAATAVVEMFPPPAAFEWSWVAFVKLAMVGVTMVGEPENRRFPVPLAPVLVTPSMVG